MLLLLLLLLMYIKTYLLSSFLDIFYRNMEFFHEGGENDFDVILADIQKEINMGDIVKELGYGCTVSVSQCREIFSLFLPLTEDILAKLLGSIARTHAGLEDNQSTFLNFSMALGYSTVSELPPLSSWNIDVLIDTIKHLVNICVSSLFFYFNH